MVSNDKVIESYKNVIATAASFAASLMLMRGMLNELVPPNVRNMLFSRISYLRSHMSSHHTIIIDQKIDVFTNNHIYTAVRTYLATRINSSMQQRLRISGMDENEKMLVSMAEGEEMVDMYDGTEFKWCLSIQVNPVKRDSSNYDDESQQVVRSFEVHFDKKHQEKALNSYLPFIVSTAKDIKQQERSLHLYMNQYTEWSPADLRHPSTFHTLAIDQNLLYGPPGTGKSSLVAAIANHLRFDIYDLELTEVSRNSDLRRLLLGMTNRSILVVEDVDCSIEMNQREESGSNPAEVAEVLIRNADTDVVLHDLVNLLESKLKDADEINTGHKDKRRKLDDKKDDSSSDEN